jgi:hypothetical protein
MPKISYKTYNKKELIESSVLHTTLNEGIYIELKDKTTIWTSYINKGYLVFFSDDGHIEVGFPDGKFHLHYRDRYEGDTRYTTDKWKPGEQQTDNLTVGAGSSVGYKPASIWAIKEKKEGTKESEQVKPYIYLEYLKFE